MKGVAALSLLLVAVRLGHPCRKVDSVLFCQNILANFEPGCSTMLVTLKNLGEINSTVLQSENLVTVTQLTSDDTGITRIAENAFSSFPNLLYLNLESNMLSELNPNWFGNPAVLRELRLAGNLIEGVNEAMLNGLTNLTKLRLNRNRIQTIHPDSFSSQRMLADLDLSENRLTWVSPQVFRSLGSLRFIRLEMNPWNCSCDAKEFVDSLKELSSRNQLNKSIDMVCESPPLLKGQPVWNVSVCLETLGTFTEPPHTGKTVTSGSSQPSSKTETSSQPKPDPVTPVTVSSHTAALPSSEKSVGPKPSDAPTPSSSGSYVTSSSSETDTHIHPKPTNTPVTPTDPVTPPPVANYVCTLAAVIAVLSVLLFFVCFMAVIQIRKRSNKTVMPGCPKDEGEEEKKLEDDSRLSHDQTAGCSENRHQEAVWRSFTGVRAKSADPVILTSPFCASDKDRVQFRAETEVSENPRNKKLLIESGAEKEGGGGGGGGGSQSDNLTTTDTVSVYDKSEDGGRNLYECVNANTDIVPYLSIGTVQNKPSNDGESTASPGQGPQRRKALRRISTWPPSAAQWQARCKKNEEEDEGFAVWTQNVTVKLSDDVEVIVNKMKHPTCPEQSEKKDEKGKNQMGSLVNLRHSDAFKSKEPFVSELKEGMSHDSAAERQTSFKISRNKEVNFEENPAHKSSSRAAVGKGLKRSVTGRQGPENRAVGSKAPSGGTSPDDETLLSGNEYAFMDLLHEVAQNNGRWTRERWKQMHVNKQRRQEPQERGSLKF